MRFTVVGPILDQATIAVGARIRVTLQRAYEQRRKKETPWLFANTKQNTFIQRKQWI